MSLIGRLVDKSADQGQHHLAAAAASRRGPTAPAAGKHLTVRFTDRKVAFDIAQATRGSALGEAYMDGRLIIEDGTILDLLELIVGANRWEDKGAGPQGAAQGQEPLPRAVPAQQPEPRAPQRRPPLRSQATSSTSSSSTTTSSTAAPISPTRPTASSRRRPTRRRISPPSSRSKPGQRVLDIGCGWGGMALYLHKVAGVDVLGVTLVRAAAEGRARARRRRPASPTM